MQSVECIRARLEKIGRTPSDAIPKADLIAASNSLLPNMEAFCAEKYFRGRLSTYGKYWEVPQVNVKIRSEGKVHNLKYNMRISLLKGGFYDWDDPSCRYPVGNPLLLWMIADDVVLSDQWQAVSKADLLRSIREIREWCAELEQEGRTPIQPKEDPEFISAIREIVHFALSEAGKFGKPLSAKKIWNLVVETTNGECKGITELESHYRLYRLLKKWVQEDIGKQPEFFTIAEKTVSRKTTFTLTASPE
jgi:hypothetical protein